MYVKLECDGAFCPLLVCYAVIPHEPGSPGFGISHTGTYAYVFVLERLCRLPSEIMLQLVGMHGLYNMLRMIWLAGCLQHCPGNMQNPVHAC